MTRVVKKLSRQRKKNKNKNRRKWQNLSHSYAYVQEQPVTKDQINQIAFAVFGGVNVSSTDL